MISFSCGAVRNRNNMILNNRLRRPRTVLHRKRRSRAPVYCARVHPPVVVCVLYYCVSRARRFDSGGGPLVIFKPPPRDTLLRLYVRRTRTFVKYVLCNNNLPTAGQVLVVARVMLANSTKPSRQRARLFSYIVLPLNVRLKTQRKQFSPFFPKQNFCHIINSVEGSSPTVTP